MNLSCKELLSQLRDMSGHEFEELIANIWEQQGWKTIVTTGSRDRGIDVVAEKSRPVSQKQLIQAKCYSSSNKVGDRDMRDFGGAMRLEDNSNIGIFVTTSSFTSPARQTADELNIKLINGKGLYQIISELDSQDFLSNYLDSYGESKRGNKVRSPSTNSVNTDNQQGSSKEGNDSTNEYSATGSREMSGYNYKSDPNPDTSFTRSGHTYNPDPNPDTSSTRSGHTYNPDPHPDTSSDTDSKSSLLNIPVFTRAISGLVTIATIVLSIFTWLIHSLLIPSTDYKSSLLNVLVFIRVISGLVTIAIIVLSILTWSVHSLLVPSIVITGALFVVSVLLSSLSSKKEDDSGKTPPRGIQ